MTMENRSEIESFDFSQIKDFAYYAPRMLQIKTYYGPKTESQVEKIIPLNLNPTQLRLHNLFENLFKTVGYVRIIVLKARREGISTYVEGRLFHKDVTTPNTHSFIIAQDKDGSQYYLRDVQTLLRHVTCFPPSNETLLIEERVSLRESK